MSDEPPGPGDGTTARDESAPDELTLGELMPWSVAALRTGRGWILAPDPATLRSRWNALIRTEDEDARTGLFGPTRSRTPHSAVAPLPGVPAHGGRLARERGACPEPVPVLHGPYDQQWLIPDHRLIDAARPELWRVSDGHQTHLVETAHDHRHPGPLCAVTALLPDGRAAAGRSGRIRPLYRRPGGREPNLLPGLLEHLAAGLGLPVTPEDMLAWTLATVRAGTAGRTVPLTRDRESWRRGVALGRRLIRLHTRGARCADAEGAAGDGGDSDDGTAGTARPRLPGGRRPYVRAPLPAFAPGPEELAHDAEERSLHIGEGRVAPVAREAWEFEAGGVRVLESWLAERTAAPPEAAGTLEAVRPANRPPGWTSQLLELITVLTLLAELRPEQRELARALEPGTPAGTETVRADARTVRAELTRAGLLPPPPGARRPASVLELPEEGPEGQLALL